MNGNSVLQEWDSDLSNLTNGYGMFFGCSELSAFYGDLSSLTTGDFMFSTCPKLTICQDDFATSTINLSNLESANGMF